MATHVRRKADRRSRSPGPMASGFKEGDETGKGTSEGTIPGSLGSNITDLPIPDPLGVGTFPWTPHPEPCQGQVIREGDR